MFELNTQNFKCDKMDILCQQNCILQAHGHKIFIVNFKLVSEQIVKWRKNREPDLRKVRQIIEYSKEDHVQWNLHVAKIPGESRFVCYDGYHRFCAMKSLGYEGNILLDYVECTEDQLLKKFIGLNRCDPVSDAYLNESDVGTEIDGVVSRFEAKYPNFFRSTESGTCQRPHIIRSTFVNIVWEIYRHFDNRFSIQQIENGLLRLNESYSKGLNLPRTATSEILGKCRSKGGLYLFIDQKCYRDINVFIVEIERILHQK